MVFLFYSDRQFPPDSWIADYAFSEQKTVGDRLLKKFQEGKFHGIPVKKIEIQGNLLPFPVHVFFICFCSFFCIILNQCLWRIQICPLMLAHCLRLERLASLILYGISLFIHNHLSLKMNFIFPFPSVGWRDLNNVDRFLLASRLP